MCEHAVVRTPAVQNKSFTPSGSPSSEPPSPFASRASARARRLAGAIWRFEYECIERARLLDSDKMRVGKFGGGKFAAAQRVARLRQRQRRQLSH